MEQGNDGTPEGGGGLETAQNWKIQLVLGTNEASYEYQPALPMSLQSDNFRQEELCDNRMEQGSYDAHQCAE